MGVMENKTDKALRAILNRAKKGANCIFGSYQKLPKTTMTFFGSVIGSKKSHSFSDV